MNKPRVTVSALGSLHQAYQVALACQEKELLKWFFTSYYYKNGLFTELALKGLRLLGLSKVEQRIRGRQLKGLNDRFVRNHIIVEALSCAFRGVGKDIENYYYVNRLYDKMVAEKLTECDIFYSYEDVCFYSLHKTKDNGAISILELRSLEPLYDEIMEEEAKIIDLPAPSYLRSKKLASFMERKFAEMEVADHLVVYSNRFKQYLMEAHSIPEEKVIVLPLGADLELFHPRRDMVREDGRFRILFVGQIIPRKGVHYLLEAVKQLNVQDIELQIVGSLSPGMKPILERYSGYFDYIEPVAHRELARYYNSAHVFVLPSLIDSFGLVICEAMSCGVPVIMTENCGVEIQDGIEGFIVPIRDVGALKEKILRLYENDELREQMGYSAQEWAREHSLEKHRKRIAAMFVEVHQKRQVSVLPEAAV